MPLVVMKLRIWLLAIVVCSSSILAAQQGASRQVEWLFYGGDPGGGKSSPLADITSDNVQRLQIAWQWKHWDTKLENGAVPQSFENTPLMVDGVLYVTTPFG